MTNKQALDALLPCFGCRSVNISISNIYGVRWGIQCHDCDLHTDPDAKTKEEAMAHWNKYFRWFLIDIPERSMMQDRTEEYDDGYLNGFEAGIKTTPQPVYKMMLDALNAVLSHVEDESAKRVNGQCTLCFSYRKMIREAIAAASSAPVVEVVDRMPDYVPSLIRAWAEKEAQCMIERRVDTSFEIGFKAAWDLLQLARQKGGV